MGITNMHSGLYAEGGFAVSTPATASNVNQTFNVSADISDEAIDRISKGVQAGSEMGSQKGANEGFSRAALEQQRDVQLMADLSI
jgi:hypothetical protein